MSHYSGPQVRFAVWCSVVVATFLLEGCGGGGGDDAAATPPTGGANRAPTISGAPPASALQGVAYTFAPTATDDDGDALTFSVSGLPSWATFDSATGRISGTPQHAHVGSYPNIAISVSDSVATATLTPFTIQVVSTAAGSVTLSWTPPTGNTDGTALTDLAGYRIYWGTAAGTYPNWVTVDNPGLTSYVVEGLTPATWYFVTTAVNRDGAESDRSNVAEKTVF